MKSSVPLVQTFSEVTSAVTPATPAASPIRTVSETPQAAGLYYANYAETIENDVAKP